MTSGCAAPARNSSAVRSIAVQTPGFSSASYLRPNTHRDITAGRGRCRMCSLDACHCCTRQCFHANIVAPFPQQLWSVDRPQCPPAPVRGRLCTMLQGQVSRRRHSSPCWMLNNTRSSLSFLGDAPFAEHQSALGPVAHQYPHGFRKRFSRRVIVRCGRRLTAERLHNCLQESPVVDDGREGLLAVILPGAK